MQHEIVAWNSEEPPLLGGDSEHALQKQAQIAELFRNRPKEFFKPLCRILGHICLIELQVMSAMPTEDTHDRCYTFQEILQSIDPKTPTPDLLWQLTAAVRSRKLEWLQNGSSDNPTLPVPCLLPDSTAWKHNESLIPQKLYEDSAISQAYLLPALLEDIHQTLEIPKSDISANLQRLQGQELCLWIRRQQWAIHNSLTAIYEYISIETDTHPDEKSSISSIDTPESHRHPPVPAREDSPSREPHSSPDPAQNMEIESTPLIEPTRDEELLQDDQMSGGEES